MEISNLRMHRKNSLRKEIPPSSSITSPTPGSCIRLGYCHYPWNCLLAALRMCAAALGCSEARPGAPLLHFAEQHCLSLQLPWPPALLGSGNPPCLQPGVQQPQNSPKLQPQWDWPAADKGKGSDGLVACDGVHRGLRKREEMRI